MLNSYDMEKDILKQRTEEILDNIINELKEKIDHVINSGCMDVDGAEDNYFLPKALASALLREGENLIGKPLGHEKRIFDEIVNSTYLYT